MPTVKQLNQSIKASRVAESGEWLDWVIYSSVVCGAANTQTTLNFFQDSIASVGRAKTNMETPAQLNSNKTFLITAIEALIFNRDGAPFRSDNSIAYGPNEMFATLCGELKINQVTQLELHGWMFRNPMERVDAVTTVGAGSIGAIISKPFKLKAPIQIDPQTNFIVSTPILTAAATTGGYSATVTEIMFMFRGLMKRYK